jgi:hypothetical protein
VREISEVIISADRSIYREDFILPFNDPVVAEL